MGLENVTGPNSLTIDASQEQATIDKARRARAAEPNRDAEEMAYTKRKGREFAERSGTHVIHGDGSYERKQVVRAQMDESLGPDQVKIGGQVTSKTAARLAGFVDENGRLTEKGKQLARATDDSPAAPAPRPSLRPGYRSADDFSFVSIKSGQRLDTVPEADIEGMIRDLRRVRGVLTPDERAAAERDAVRLEQELARRQGVDDEDAAEDEYDSADDDAIDSGWEEIDQAIERAFDARNYDEVVDAAAWALNDPAVALGTSPAYRAAVDAYVNRGIQPSDEVFAAIGEDLGRDASDAEEKVAMVVMGFRAEAAAAVDGILAPEQLDSFEDFLELRKDLARSAIRQHAKTSSTQGWVEAAREFAERVRGVDPHEFAGTHDDGGMVWEEGGRWWVQTKNGVVKDFYAALASGRVRPV